MPLELDRETRATAIASIERWFQEELDQRVGNITAGALLGFFLTEIAPSVYNRAVADVQEKLLQRVQELDLEIHEDEFRYWQQKGAAAAGRKR